VRINSAVCGAAANVRAIQSNHSETY
jgi:hypothetical protein